MSEDYIGLGTLLLIFGVVLFPISIYIYTGHKNELLFGRAMVSIRNATKEDLKRIGKILFVIDIIITIIGGVLLFKGKSL